MKRRWHRCKRFGTTREFPYMFVHWSRGGTHIILSRSCCCREGHALYHGAHHGDDDRRDCCRQPVRAHVPAGRQLAYGAPRRVFYPEFINRIDSTALFNSLGPDTYNALVDLELGRLSARRRAVAGRSGCMQQCETGSGSAVLTAALVRVASRERSGRRSLPHWPASWCRTMGWKPCRTFLVVT